MIFDLKPIAHIHSVAIDRQIATLEGVEQEKRNQLFRILERTIIVGAVESVREHRFHHISNNEVYGSLGPQDPAFSETTPYQPNSPYSASKIWSRIPIFKSYLSPSN